MLGADVVVIEVTGLFLGEHHDHASPFGEPFEHRRSLLFRGP
jgi:hypothetical protein